MSDDPDTKQKELWRGAYDRVTPWGKPEKDDYDFRSWMKGASKELLEAGCIYEYVRESRKLRGLLVLMNPERKREPLETTLSSSGRVRHLPCSFEGLREEDARRALGGALRWLQGYAEELVENMSFAKLLRTKGDEVKRSLGERTLRFPKSRAVQLAGPFIGDYGPPPWPWQPWSPKLFTGETGPQGFPLISLPDRHIRDDGLEKIAIEVRWGDSNRKIGKEMERVARLQRPKAWKKPKRERTRREILAKVKALSVMRIWKRFPHRDDRWQRIEEVGKCTGYKSCVDAFRTEGAGTSDAANAKMSRARDAALSFFRSLGTGEMPANWIGDLSTEVAQVVR
jgi:hypothetical protein